MWLGGVLESQALAAGANCVGADTGEGAVEREGPEGAVEGPEAAVPEAAELGGLWQAGLWQAGLSWDPEVAPAAIPGELAESPESPEARCARRKRRLRFPQAACG